jgi:hypothetical protein
MDSAGAGFCLTSKSGEKSKMKKSLLLILIAMTGFTASAADLTKEQYFARYKKYVESKGWTYKEEKAESIFAERDKDKNGLLSDEEVSAPLQQKPVD